MKSLPRSLNTTLDPAATKTGNGETSSLFFSNFNKLLQPVPLKISNSNVVSCLLNLFINQSENYLVQ